MNDRRQSLLKVITEKYIETAQPVSSKFITEFGGFDLSSATIRNEMAALESDGYIFHPHTSSGRVPTQKGYEYFVATFLEDRSLNKKHQDKVDSFLSASGQQDREPIKSLAKGIAEVSDGAVFLAFSPNDFYYTGISNLFGQPEFLNHQLVHHLSQVIDHLDLMLHKIFADVDKTSVLIGNKNPFSADCSSIITKYKFKQEEGVIGILGPVRMDYQKNYSLINYSQSLINKLK